MIIVGNISDEYEIDRKVPLRRAMETALYWKCDHIECNAKDNINIMGIFEKSLTQLSVQFDLYAAVCVVKGNMTLN